MEEKQVPVFMIAQLMEQFIFQITGKQIQINLPLQSEKDKENFITMMNLMGIEI